MTSAAPTTAFSFPKVSFPEDPALSDLPYLFDPEWVWRAYCRQFGRLESDPWRIRIRQFSHSPGRTATVSYEVGWGPDEYMAPQIFVIKMERDRPGQLFRYPEDPHLPGLKEAASPEGAFRLMNRHVLAIPARRAMFVGLVRYRPGNRAVLHHRVGRAGFYARVMRPPGIAALLTARELIGGSGFVVPRLAGRWTDGGVHSTFRRRMTGPSATSDKTCRTKGLLCASLTTLPEHWTDSSGPGSPPVWRITISMMTRCLSRTTAE